MKTERPRPAGSPHNLNKKSRFRAASNPRSNKSSVRDALRVLVALVGILFASLASVDQETPATHQESQQIATSAVTARDQARRAKARELKRLKPEVSALQRLDGAIAGSI